MEQEVKNKKNELTATKKGNRTYDLFISYRRIPRLSNDDEIDSEDENDLHHSTSVVRAIALEYKLRGLDVYFDCDTSPDKKNEKYYEALNNSRNYIVLLADYSFKENGGSNFRYELDFMLDLMRIQELEKNNLKDEKNTYCELKKKKRKKIFWIDIDGRFKRYLDLVKNNGIHEDAKRKTKIICISEEEIARLERQEKAFQTIKEKVAQTKITLLPINTTDQNLTRYLPKIKKCPRFSFKTTKVLSWLFAVVFVALAIITPLYYEVSQPGALFVGGGTVKAYLLEDKGIDVDNYAPNSKYIHLPSGVSSSVLQDIVNEESCHYYPILLSTGRLAYDSTWMDEFLKKRKILQVFLGNVPLMVQFSIQNCPNTIDKDKDSITVNDLKSLLYSLNANDHYHTTSPNSGTYNKYASILHINDSLLKVKPTVFNQRYLPDDEDTVGFKVILANEKYYYGQFEKEKADMFITMSVYDSTGTKVQIPLYAYAATEKLDTEKTTEVEISRPVLRFIQKFNSTIKARHPKAPLEDKIFLIIKNKDN